MISRGATSVGCDAAFSDKQISAAPRGAAFSMLRLAGQTPIVAARVNTAFHNTARYRADNHGYSRRRRFHAEKRGFSA